MFRKIFIKEDPKMTRKKQKNCVNQKLLQSYVASYITLYDTNLNTQTFFVTTFKFTGNKQKNHYNHFCNYFYLKTKHSHLFIDMSLK